MNVYLRAAQIVFKDGAGYWGAKESCVAINEADGKPLVDRDGYWNPCSKAVCYQRLFSPTGSNGDHWLDGFLKSDLELHKWRLTALCFAAAMHDTGDL